MLDIDYALLGDLARVSGGAGVFIYFFIMLLKRGDSLQRENIDELRHQRDDLRERLETAEAQVTALQSMLSEKSSRGGGRE